MKTVLANVRLTGEELADWKERARVSGKTFSGWVRDRVREQIYVQESSIDGKLEAQEQASAASPSDVGFKAGGLDGPGEQSVDAIVASDILALTKRPGLCSRCVRIGIASCEACRAALKEVFGDGQQESKGQAGEVDNSGQFPGPSEGLAPAFETDAASGVCASWSEPVQLAVAQPAASNQPVLKNPRFRRAPKCDVEKCERLRVPCCSLCRNFNQ